MVLRTVSVRPRNGRRKNLDLLGIVVADHLDHHLLELPTILMGTN
jgi:hypothetical protein